MRTFSIENIAKIQYTERINDEFALGKCYVMATGKNRNFSSIAKSVVERNIGTLDFCPVVGFLYKNKNGEFRIAGHECEVDEDWEIVPTTQAFGVVKPNSYGWEIVEEYGVEVEYLVADVILWVGRFKGLFDARYNDEVWYSQSMEINVQEYRNLEEDSNYVEILDFSFSALCLLGKYDNSEENITPCFINAKVEPKFSISDFASQIEEIKNKLFSLEKAKEEGETMEDNKELMSAETENTEVVTETEVEVQAEGTESAEAEASTESEAEVDTEAEVVSEEGTEDTDADTQEETVDYEAKYNEALAEIESLKAQVSQLEPYRLAAEQAERDKAESDVFAKYDSHIGEMEEYKTLKSKASEYSIEELDRECLILVGKFAMNTPAQTEETEVKSTITFGLDNESETKPQKYGKVYEAYKTR